MRSNSTSLIKCCNKTGTMFGMKTYREAMMERTILGKCRNRFWYFVFTISFSWFLFVYLYKSSMLVSTNEAIFLGNNSASSIDYNQELRFVHSRKISRQAVDDIIQDHENESTTNETKQVDNHIENPFQWGEWVEIANEVLASENETEPVKEVGKNRVKSSHVLKRTTGGVAKKPERKKQPAKAEIDYESCKGKFIYIHHLPRRFNEDLLRHCSSLSNWNNMCDYTSNKGLGPQMTNYEKVYSNTGWFATDQFLLEVIFHNRMKQYKCLTSNSSLASAIFVPYYPGLDLNRYLWSDLTMKQKDLESLFLVKWLRRKPEWKRMGGRDHFLVAGRISWDFRRDSDNDSDWGNKLLLFPETRNMTTLVIESSPWNNNDFAIPYPTYFHPSTDDEVFNWQARMREQKRSFLFSFAGGPRHNLPNSIRDEVIDQCKASRKCKFMECDRRSSNRCYKPVYVMKMFQSSVFCLQPAGDSFTRRSTFDSILAGCIPVFFHPGSAYVQYIWHLPRNYTKYSVFIPDFEVKHGKANIERILDRISEEEILSMREEVIRLIPKLIYADPSSRLETLEDAFDITVKGVLDRIEGIRREMSEGEKNLTTDLAEKVAWKYNFYGTLGKHEWDPFFVRPRII